MHSWMFDVDWILGTTVAVGSWVEWLELHQFSQFVGASVQGIGTGGAGHLQRETEHRAALAPV